MVFALSLIRQPLRKMYHKVNLCSPRLAAFSLNMELLNFISRAKTHATSTQRQQTHTAERYAQAKKT
jgi:hypothetical protein